MDQPVLTPLMLLNAYANGLFPMAEHHGADAPVYLYHPDPRTLLTIRDSHIPVRVRRWLRHTTLRVGDADVRTVMEQCGQDRAESWINPVLLDAYAQLADDGFAQALGVYAGADLVGGIYWVQIGTAVMAESMFSRVSNASKLALASLLSAIHARGKRLGLTLDQQWMDVQYVNAHLEQFHPTQITDDAYQSLLGVALSASEAGFVPSVSAFVPADFSTASLADFLQFKTQIS